MSKETPRLGVLLRAHDRPLTTRIILNELREYQERGIAEVTLSVLLDRPTQAVSQLVRNFRAKNAYPIEVLRAPRAMLDHRGEHFLENQNTHLDHFERTFGSADWLYISDDDYWLEPRLAYERLGHQLRRPDVSLYFVECLFFQDDTDTYNPHREHHSAFFFRHIPGDRHSGRRMLKVPDATYDQGLMSNAERPLGIPCLEYGGFTLRDREAIRAAYLAAGKTNDAFVDALLQNSSKRFPDDYHPAYGVWFDRMKENLHG